MKFQKKVKKNCLCLHLYLHPGPTLALPWPHPYLYFRPSRKNGKRFFGIFLEDHLIFNIYKYKRNFKRQSFFLQIWRFKNFQKKKFLASTWILDPHLHFCSPRKNGKRFSRFFFGRQFHLQYLPMKI
jgi:hypothetical protein